MAVDPIVLAVPMYFVFMGAEWWWDRRRNLGLYRLNDALTNLACGAYQQLLVALLTVPLEAPYHWLYDHARATDWFAAHPVVAWLVAFVAADFFYYWFHRWSHESAVGWFSHVVHHQSEDYNLSVALRQDAWQPLFSLWFQLPLALMGVPPSVFASAYGVVIVYQFWIHTKLIDRLPAPLEAVFNTPSHHRVHHGVDPAYLDRNYAGVFIVWDRLFGTFTAESQSPTYGTIEPVASWNPVWVHLQYGAKLLAKMARAEGLATAAQVLVRGPGWQPPGWPAEDLNAMADARRGAPRYDVTAARATTLHAVVVFALAMLLSVVVLQRPVGADAVNLAAATLSVWGLANVGGLLEARAWASVSQGLWWVSFALSIVAGAAYAAR